MKVFITTEQDTPKAVLLTRVGFTHISQLLLLTQVSFALEHYWVTRWQLVRQQLAYNELLKSCASSTGSTGAPIIASPSYHMMTDSKAPLVLEVALPPGLRLLITTQHPVSGELFVGESVT